MAQLGVDLIRKHQGNAQAILTHAIPARWPPAVSVPRWG
jgi:hypothetical protein